jgi:zinc protease
VQAALAQELARVREKPVAAQELEKAKNQLASAFIFGLQTVDGVATALGQAQYVYGDWREFPKGASRYLAVTAADVTRVAHKYLVESNLTAVTLKPAVPPQKGAGK